jgi:ketosteroid isomerase-like protein
MLLRVSFCTLAFLLVLGCASRVSSDAVGSAVREADAAWSETSEKRDFEAFLTFVSDSAAFYPGDGRVLRGKKEVGDFWKRFFDPSGASVVWQPTDAEASSAGDLGYTRGVWKFTQDGPEGRQEATGKYVTIWRKEADGKWRAIVDIGDSDEEPGPPPPAAPSSPDTT